jgi:hypothetical protein
MLNRSLPDVQLARGNAFVWQLPTGSFIDRDSHDTLSYSAQLANGKPLPDWIEFDAASGTFSGEAPASARGALDVRVVASDGHGACSAASDVFRISFGKHAMLPKGNEGVGNGEDPPPPGRDRDWNDGPGTGQGHPGSMGGGRRDEDRPTDRDRDRSHPSGVSDDWFKDWGVGGHGRKQGLSYLDLGLIDRYRDPAMDDCRHEGGRQGNDFYRRWAEMETTLARLLAEGVPKQGWEHPINGADLRGLPGLTCGGQNSMRGGIDPVTLTAGTDLSLRGFRGLQEGIERLG